MRRPLRRTLSHVAFRPRPSNASPSASRSSLPLRLLPDRRLRCRRPAARQTGRSRFARSWPKRTAGRPRWPHRQPAVPRSAILRQAAGVDVGGHGASPRSEGHMRSSRTAQLGAVGVVAALVLVIVVGANALGIMGGSPSSSPVAQASVPPASTATTEPTTTASPTASPSPTPVATPTAVPTPVTVAAPLTGERVDPAIARRHPIAVMIDDLRPARPQSGLSQADIVWQAPAEGGIPRYMAIFQTELPKDIGPVRSSRYYYITWAAEWRAIYTHAGGSPQALATLRAKGNGQYVYNLDAFRRPAAFRRIHTRLAPHNLYTTGP